VTFPAFWPAFCLKLSQDGHPGLSQLGGSAVAVDIGDGVGVEGVLQ
jgi:hypothetical protein